VGRGQSGVVGDLLRLGHPFKQPLKRVRPSVLAPDRPTIALARDVVTSLPEVPVVSVEFLGDGLLQRLDRAGQRRAFGFADEQVDVLGHYHVAHHVEAIATTGLFEGALECFSGVGCVEEGLSTITAEGDEVQSPGLLETYEPPRHGERLRFRRFRDL